MRTKYVTVAQERQDLILVRTQFDYSPATGELRTRSTGRLLDGTSNGYISVRFKGKSTVAHRLIWLYVYGRWPIEQVDHINGNKADNRLSNLRECTNAQNCQNVRPHRDGSGTLGISWMEDRGKWQAAIGVNGERIPLGYHETKEQASAAYLAAKQIYHPFGASK